jgi:hypothetical protein
MIAFRTAVGRLTTQIVAACAILTALASFGRAEPEWQLKNAFFAQLASAGVQDFQRTGNQATFTVRYGSSPNARWRVHVDAATVEHASDGSTLYKGSISSSWYVDDRPIVVRGDQADLPLRFLDAGVAQECWALWDSHTRLWSWK